MMQSVACYSFHAFLHEPVVFDTAHFRYQESHSEVIAVTAILSFVYSSFLGEQNFINRSILNSWPWLYEVDFGYTLLVLLDHILDIGQ
jgi:hypothetical protein